MSRITVELGSSPCDEACAQVGSDGYAERSQAECRAYGQQLRRHYFAAHQRALEDVGVAVKVQSNLHDYGSYREVVAVCEEDNGTAMNALFWLEANLPDNWDDEALAQLGAKTAL